VTLSGILRLGVEYMIYESKADEKRYFMFANYTKKGAPTYDPMPHFHNSLEIFFVDRGFYEVYVGGERRLLSAGDVAFVDPYVLHTSGRREECEDFSVYVIVAGNEYYSYTEWLKSDTLPSFFRVKDQESLSALFEWAHRSKDELDEDMRAGFISLLLGKLKGSTELVHRSGEKRSELLVEIIKYLGEHYAEDLTLELLASKFGYEKTYLSRLIGKATGMNLREYLNRMRYSAAAAMKRTRPDLPMYKIAEECGFGSENTFYRCARRFDQKHNF